MDFGLLRQAAREAFSGTSVRFAYLFGSHATGRDGPLSDVDVAVWCEPRPADPLEERIDLALAFERAAGRGPVDLVLLQDARPALLRRILRERVILWSCDEPLRVRTESLGRRMAHDFAIHSDRLDRELLEAIAQGRR